MEKTRRHYLVFLSAALCAAMLLGGCLAKTPAATPAPEETPTAFPPTATPEPLIEGTVCVPDGVKDAGIIQYLFDSDPGVGDTAFISAAHPGLYRQDAATAELIPMLAKPGSTAWQPADDKWVLPVTIDTTLVWSDAFRLSAEDILFSFNLVKRLTEDGIGSHHELFKAANMELVDGETVNILLSIDPATVSGTSGLFSFPVIQQAYWEEKLADLFASREYASLRAGLANSKLSYTERWNLEQEQFILLQQVSDTAATLREVESTLKTMEDYYNNRTVGTNKNGMKDDETASAYFRLIPGYRSLVVQIKEVAGEQNAGLLQNMQAIHTANTSESGILEGAGQFLSSSVIAGGWINDSDYPLLIPYAIRRMEPGEIQLSGLAVDAGMADVVTFKACDPGSPGTAAQQSIPVTTTTAMLFLPDSSLAIYPAFRDAFSCLASDPAMFSSLAPDSSLSLMPFEDALPQDINRLSCSGDRQARVAYALKALEKGGFSWQEDVNRQLIAGTMLTPAGENVGLVSVAVDTSAGIPEAYLEELGTALAQVGMEIRYEPVTGAGQVFSTGKYAVYLAAWNSTAAAGNGWCAFMGLPYARFFPVHFQQALNRDCGYPDIPVQAQDKPAPTPLYLASGNLAKTEMGPQLWGEILFSRPGDAAWTVETAGAGLPGLLVPDVSFQPVWIK